MEECVFCKIIRGQIPGDRVLEDDRFIAIHDINPKAPVHVLVMPRAHLVSLNEIEGAGSCFGQDMLTFVARVAEAVGVRQSGYRVVTNSGPDAGQEVDHLHLHVLGGRPLRSFW
jgi:histidine triad (HIT) family protein